MTTDATMDKPATVFDGLRRRPTSRPGWISVTLFGVAVALAFAYHVVLVAAPAEGPLSIILRFACLCATIAVALAAATVSVLALVLKRDLTWAPLGIAVSMLALFGFELSVLIRALLVK